VLTPVWSRVAIVEATLVVEEPPASGYNMAGM
jgi:hypothetical protein